MRHKCLAARPRHRSVELRGYVLSIKLNLRRSVGDQGSDRTVRPCRWLRRVEVVSVATAGQCDLRQSGMVGAANRDHKFSVVAAPRPLYRDGQLRAADEPERFEAAGDMAHKQRVAAITAAPTAASDVNHVALRISWSQRGLCDRDLYCAVPFERGIAMSIKVGDHEGAQTADAVTVIKDSRRGARRPGRDRKQIAKVASAFMLPRHRIPQTRIAMKLPRPDVDQAALGVEPELAAEAAPAVAEGVVFAQILAAVGLDHAVE